MVKTVVILGAGWAGLPLAFKLLKHTLPKVDEGLKVILVSPNSHFYWNVAAVRGVIPGAIPDDQLFLPIIDGFSQYSADSFEFVLGKAEHIDPDNNNVRIAKNDKSQLALRYDHLVIATGSHVRSNLPFKPMGTHEETIEALQALQKEIEAAKSIIIAGAGPTGVETAGEIAAAYGSKKEVTLVIGGDRVLESSNVLPSVSQTIESDLKKLGVKLVHNVQVKGSQTNSKSGPTTVTLSNGSTLSADLYLPLFGIKLNTSFIPDNLLDAAGNLNLDPTMRVLGTKNIWGIGDIGNLEVKQLTVTDAQIIHLSNTLDTVLTSDGAEVKEYKPGGKTMVFVTMGKKYATGQIGGWRLWGWIVAYVKGRTLFVDTASSYVAGKALRHAAM